MDQKPLFEISAAVQRPIAILVAVEFISQQGLPYSAPSSLRFPTTSTGTGTGHSASSEVPDSLDPSRTSRLCHPEHRQARLKEQVPGEITSSHFPGLESRIDHLATRRRPSRLLSHPRQAYTPPSPPPLSRLRPRHASPGRCAILHSPTTILTGTTILTLSINPPHAPACEKVNIDKGPVLSIPTRRLHSYHTTDVIWSALEPWGGEGGKGSGANDLEPRGPPYFDSRELPGRQREWRYRYLGCVWGVRDHLAGLEAGQDLGFSLRRSSPQGGRRCRIRVRQESQVPVVRLEWRGGGVLRLGKGVSLARDVRHLVGWLSVGGAAVPSG